MPKVTTRKIFEDVITAIKNKGLSIDTPTHGTTVDLDPDIRLEILASNAGTYEDLNNYSIVFKLTYGSKSFLFTVDAEDVSEKEMLSKGYDLKADVLKVGHHGSNSSTTPEFLSAVLPQYAVISVEKSNDYSHPTQATLDKLKNAGVAVYRTDENGTVIATCDGTSIIFNTTPGSYNGASNVSNNSNPSTNSSTVNNTPAPAPTTDNQSTTVYVTKTDKKYHRDGCSSLRRSKIPMSLQDAKNSGYTPCELFDPPQ